MKAHIITIFVAYLVISSSARFISKIDESETALKAESTPKPDPETTPKPDPETTPKPDPDTTPKPDPETTPKPNPDTTTAGASSFTFTTSLVLLCAVAVSLYQ